MYALYKRTRIEGYATRYELIKNICLFGCNSGYIPRLLKNKIKTLSDPSEPFRWHIDVLSELDAQQDHLSSTLIIDLKPNQRNINLYEVLDVWGFSDCGWTPIMLQLTGLFVDKDIGCTNRNEFIKDFIRNDAELERPIYEFLYLDGSVKDGKISGRWCAPPASPTNAALLWPKPLNYFVQCIRECTPGILNHS